MDGVKARGGRGCVMRLGFYHSVEKDKERFLASPVRGASAHSLAATLQVELVRLILVSARKQTRQARTSADFDLTGGITSAGWVWSTESKVYIFTK